MLSKHEQQQFEQVCLEHIWAAVGMHALCSASGSEADARSAATTVRDLVNVAPAYRACWDRVKPIVQTQGFRSFINIVDSATPDDRSGALHYPDDAPDLAEATGAPTLRCIDGVGNQRGELAAERVLAIDTPERHESAPPVVKSTQGLIRHATAPTPPKKPRTARRTLPLGRLRVLEGKFSGRELDLIQVLTEFGPRDKHTVAILRQKNGYTIVATKDVLPDDAPQVNGTPVGSRSRILKDNDIVQIAGIKARFMLT